jgi:hypothetical protein
MDRLTIALAPALLLLTAIAATPTTQAAGVAVVVTTAATTDGDLFGANCTVSTNGFAVVSGLVVFGLNERRVGDAFYTGIGVTPVPAPYGATGGLFVNGVKVGLPSLGYNPAHTYFVSGLPLGTVCFTFEDSQYSDNAGVISIAVV